MCLRVALTSSFFSCQVAGRWSTWAPEIRSLLLPSAASVFLPPHGVADSPFTRGAGSCLAIRRVAPLEFYPRGQPQRRWGDRPEPTPPPPDSAHLADFWGLPPLYT